MPKRAFLRRFGQHTNSKVGHSRWKTCTLCHFFPSTILEPLISAIGQPKQFRKGTSAEIVALQENKPWGRNFCTFSYLLQIIVKYILPITFILLTHIQCKFRPFPNYISFIKSNVFPALCVNLNSHLSCFMHSLKSYCCLRL